MPGMRPPIPHSWRRHVRLVALLLLAGAVSTGTGCGSARDKAMLKQASSALKGGDPKGAARLTKQVLQKSPRNLMALRMLRKVKGSLLKKADGDIRAKNYDAALEKLQVLLELEPDHERATAMQIVARKHRHVGRARDAQTKREIGTALVEVRKALLADANFEEAEELLQTLMEQRDDEVTRLVGRAQELLQTEEYSTVIQDMQQVLKMDDANARAQEFLHEAQVAVLAKERRANMEAARAFYGEGRYEAAIEKADAILAVDPTNFEAKQIKERSQAESTRPELILTGISLIRNIPTAAVEIPSLGERKIVREGSEIGPYRATEIRMAERTVLFEFIPTGSIIPYTTLRE